jgi:F420-dependent oxidoreductase-like protein
MHLGVGLLYWPWLSAEEQISMAQLADRLGFDSVWVSETWGQDAVALLAHLAAVTQRIALGTAVLEVPARQPTAVAAAAATLTTLSGGRIRLGLGLGPPQISEGWYGVPFTSPLTRTREYVEIVRAALTGRPLDYPGKVWSIPTRRHEHDAEPHRLMAPGTDHRIPIYLGVSGPKTVEQAGAIADGWISFLLPPEEITRLMGVLQRGIEKAGRRRSQVDVTAAVAVAVDEDITVARNQLRPLLAFYVAMGDPDTNRYIAVAERWGHGKSARAARARFASGDGSGAEALISDAVVDLLAVAATPAALPARLDAYKAAGVDSLIAVPFGNRTHVLTTLAAHLVGTSRLTDSVEQQTD